MTYASSPPDRPPTEEESPQTLQDQLRAGCLPALLFLYILFALLFGQLARVVALFAGVTLSHNAALLITAALVVLPLGLLLWRTGPGRARAAYHSWSLALLFALFMIPVGWIAPVETQLAGLLRLGLAALYLTLLHLLLRRFRPRRPPASPRNVSLALALGALMALPWFILGALGSPLDILINLAGGLLLGWAAALIIANFLLAVIEERPAGYWQDTIMGGLVVSLALFFLAVNYDPNGASLLLVIILPPLAWPALALGLITREGRSAVSNWPALALLIGLATALPLLSSDPEMLPLDRLAFGRETIFYALITAGLTLLLSPLFYFLLALPRAWWADSLLIRRRFIWSGAGALWLLAWSAYFLAGQPGLYGDELFVILKEQADVSAADDIENYDARRQFVYDSLVVHASESQSDLRRWLDFLPIEYTPYYLVNGLQVQGGLPTRLLLSFHPDVDRVLLNPVLRPLPRRPAPATGSEAAPQSPPWNLEQIGAPRVWAELGVRGAGIIVGQSDSGVQGEHPELIAGYRDNQAGNGAFNHGDSWFDPWYGDAIPTDDHGHGTHTLATAVGKTVGVAPDAGWIGCKNQARGMGNMANYLDCMQFMLAPFPLAGDPWRDGDPLRAAHVLNNSWGCPADLEGCDPGALQPAIDALRAAGIFIVVSAGNDGPACSSVSDPPAIYDSAYVVGAVDRYGRVTGFSSVGPVLVDGSDRLKPDIVAPGHEILSAYPNDSFNVASGTSMAGPHVAGVVALLWSANPKLIGDIAATEAILAASAAPYQPQTLAGDQRALVEDFLLTLGSEQLCRDESDTSVLPNNIVGYGVIDAFQAVQMALETR